MLLTPDCLRRTARSPCIIALACYSTLCWSSGAPAPAETVQAGASTQASEGELASPPLDARGFQRPGDYNSRFLLLIDGIRTNDAVYDQAAIGTDFPLDMDLVERIEYVPGPGSAVYGSNALFGAAIAQQSRTFLLKPVYGPSRASSSAVTLALAVFALMEISAHAQVDESALKAAYIFNFTQFTTWPPGHLSDSRLVVCANKESQLGSALSKLDGRAVGGRSWVVDRLPAKDGAGKCNVIVLASDDPTGHQLKDVRSSDQPVLVISDFDTGERSAVIHLCPDDNHLRFDIDNSQALRRRLALSSKLLHLARRVL